jgi:hypothetical protein
MIIVMNNFSKPYELQNRNMNLLSLLQFLLGAYEVELLFLKHERNKH